MRTEAERKRVCDFVMQIEEEFSQGTIKQLVCLLISRLLNPIAIEETAGVMLAFARKDKLEDKEETIH